MCGIFGIINTNNRKFDKATFNVLGVENDSRGGDSCGIFIDGRYEYGVTDKKLYKNFFVNSELLKSTDKCRIALGHCRKASVGAINEQNAQPVIIKNEEDKVEFVLIHNGTIINYKELAKKYIPNVDITNMTDSQVIARIFYYSGYDVLGEYIGAGAFVIVDYRDNEPQIMLFKGESKTQKNGIVVQVERPLYFVATDKDFVFSSLSTYLTALRPGATLYTIPSNKLVELDKTSIRLIKEYDRKDLWQTEPYKATNYYNYYDYDDYYDTSYRSSYSNTRKVVGTLTCNEDLLFNVNKMLCHGLYNITRFGVIYNEEVKGITKDCYVWRGVMLKNKKCFEFLEELRKSYNATPYDIQVCFPQLISYLSMYPVLAEDGLFEVATSPNTSKLFTGVVSVSLNYKDFNITDGKLVSNKYNNKIKYDFHKELENFKDYKIDVEQLENFLYTV